MNNSNAALNIIADLLSNAPGDISSNAALNLIQQAIEDANQNLSNLKEIEVGDLSNLNYNAETNTITFLSGYGYKILNSITLPNECQIICPHEVAIYGSSSETASLNFNNSTRSCIVSTGSLPLRNLLFTNSGSSYIFDLDGSAQSNSALDWIAVNITGSKGVLVRNYSNFVVRVCAFLGVDEGIRLEGTLGSLVIEASLLQANGNAGALIDITSTAIITRRIRLENSPFIAFNSTTAINVDVNAVVPVDSYIVKYCNFSGNATYLTGVQPNDNRALFIGNKGVGIENTSAIALLYLESNATPVTITTPNTYTPVTLNYTVKELSKFEHLNGLITSQSAISTKFKVSMTCTFTSGNNNQVSFKLVKNGNLNDALTGTATANASGRAENVPLQDAYTLAQNDTIQLYIANSNVTDVLPINVSILIEALN